MKTAIAVGLGVAMVATMPLGARAQQPKQAQQPINFAEMFLQLDANNDTVIDLDEVPESGRAAFKKLLELGDTDKNGRLEVAELRALGEKVRRAGLFPSLTPQQRFLLLDKNNDGKIPRDEFTGNPEVFDRLDADKDGVLTLEEMLKAPGFPAGPAALAQLRERLKSMDNDGDGRVSRIEFLGAPALFDRLDANKDGVLNQDDEGSAAVPAPGANSGTTGQTPAKSEQKPGEPEKNDSPKAGSGQFGPRFRAMDTNSDGKLTREEFQGVPANFDRMDLNKDGLLTPDEIVRATALGAARRFKMMDKNGDDKLSRDEFTGPSAMFDRLDTNSDGFLSKEEAAKFQGPGGAAAKAKKKP